MNTEFRLMPEQASSISAEVDLLYYFLVLITCIFSTIIAVLIVVFAIRYRQGSPADRTRGKSHFFALELAWIGVPLVLTMVMFFWGARLYFTQARAPAGAIEITGVGRQWMWKFQHPAGNSEINDLHVPLGQPVKIKLISEDVIHSLYIPAFRVKQDVLPGRYTSLWFEATKPGQYHLFCAEYCGAKHSEMRGVVHVLEPAQYQAWLAGRLPEESPAAAGRRLFEQLRCNSCHQRDGLASRGPPLENLLGSTVRLRSGESVIADETYIRESILLPNAKIVAGFEPIMPSFEGQIGEEGILQLIAEIKALSPSPQPQQSPADAATQPHRSPP